MKIKSILLSLILCFFLAWSASALPVSVSWDLDGVGITGAANPDADNQTGYFTDMTFYAETSVTQFDDDGTAGFSVGDSFVDNGNLVGTGIVPTNLDSEGLGSNPSAIWEMTGVMSGFGGYVSAISAPDGNGDTRIDFTYTTGTLSLYADSNIDNNFNSRGFDGYLDDSGFGASATSTLVATFTVDYGLGHTFLDFTNPGEVSNQGSGEFALTSTFLRPDFWFVNGQDVTDTTPLNWFINFVDYNVDDPILVTFDPNVHNVNDPFLFKVDVTHDGSMNWGVVPEPTTMLLFGIGLLGVAGIGRRKEK